MHKLTAFFYKYHSFFLCLLCAITLLVPAEASAAVTQTQSDSGYHCYLDDAADFLTEEQEKSLMKLMLQIAQYCNVSFATSTNHTYSSAEWFAVGAFEENFGTHASGVSFVIDRKYNSIYLISEGAMRKTITNGRCNSITDNTYIYATEGHGYDYYTCAYQTFE